MVVDTFFLCTAKQHEVLSSDFCSFCPLKKKKMPLGIGFFGSKCSFIAGFGRATCKLLSVTLLLYYQVTLPLSALSP